MKDSKKQEHKYVTRMVVCGGSDLCVLMVATGRSEELCISPSTCVRAGFFFPSFVCFVWEQRGWDKRERALRENPCEMYVSICSYGGSKV